MFTNFAVSSNEINELYIDDSCLVV